MVASVAPLIWSVLNHTDKYLLKKYSGHAGIGALSILSSIFAVVPLPFIFILDDTVFKIQTPDLLVLITTGVLTAVGIFFYFHALDHDDASHVVPFWFLVPIISYFLGIIFLSEFITTDKIIGSGITLLGAFVLSLEFDSGVTIKKITPILMMASSFFLAINNILFKMAANDYSFWVSIFWNQVGMLLFGLSLLLFVKRYRKDFFTMLINGHHELLTINVVGEVLQIVAGFFAFYSVLIAPVSLVLLVNYTIQPLFVFIEGLLLTFIFPGFVTEKINRRHSIQKLSAIVIMAIGIYYIML